MEIKVNERICAQGDVLFRRIDDLPSALVEAARPAKGGHVVAHSETGHNHEVESQHVRMFEKATRDPMICYLAVDGAFAEVIHHRQFDTHKTVRLAKGIWEVRRQRESAPEGWRRVED